MGELIPIYRTDSPHIGLLVCLRIQECKIKAMAVLDVDRSCVVYCEIKDVEAAKRIIAAEINN